MGMTISTTVGEIQRGLSILGNAEAGDWTLKEVHPDRVLPTFWQPTISVDDLRTAVAEAVEEGYEDMQAILSRESSMIATAYPARPPIWKHDPTTDIVTFFNGEMDWQ